MKLWVKISTIIILILLGGFIILQAQSFTVPNSSDIERRLNYLERVVKEPIEPGNEILSLKQENYEFMLFSYAYTSYAATNLALRDSSYRDVANRIIYDSINHVLEPEIYSPYGINENLAYLDSIPDYSVLYLGHLNLMLGTYRLLSPDTTFNTLNDRISKSLFDRYNQTSFLNLESYNSSIWIPDNTVALASLKLHSFNTGSNFDAICEQWISYARTNYLDNETGVLISTVNPITGTKLEEPRGSMLGWSINFIYQFDSDFAVELYENYKQHFSTNLGIFRLFKERHNVSKTSMGDIDSGPILYGYSIPANEFALANAVLSKDFKTAKRIERLIDAGTTNVTTNNELKYEVRFLDMNISPMAEALVLYSLTMTKWISE